MAISPDIQVESIIRKIGKVVRFTALGGIVLFTNDGCTTPPPAAPRATASPTPDAEEISWRQAPLTPSIPSGMIRIAAATSTPAPPERTETKGPLDEYFARNIYLPDRAIPFKALLEQQKANYSLGPKTLKIGTVVRKEALPTEYLPYQYPADDKTNHAPDRPPLKPLELDKQVPWEYEITITYPDGRQELWAANQIDWSDEHGISQKDWRFNRILKRDEKGNLITFIQELKLSAA